jgi:hypothetical protein
MQTFLPTPDFLETAKILDNKRLNKQIVEAYQILSGRVPTKNHPACLMWEGHEYDLSRYIATLCSEYYMRFGKSHAIREHLQGVKFYSFNSTKKPFWLGDGLFHFSQRVNLLRKDFDYYHTKKFFGGISKDSLDRYPKGYYWPVAKPNGTAHKDRMNWIEWSIENIFKKVLTR